jgi:hypothetical protein
MKKSIIMAIMVLGMSTATAIAQDRIPTKKEERAQRKAEKSVLMARCF